MTLEEVHEKESFDCCDSTGNPIDCEPSIAIECHPFVFADRINSRHRCCHPVMGNDGVLLYPDLADCHERYRVFLCAPQIVASSASA